MTEREPRAEIGSACSTAFVFDDRRGRHVAITIHHDGSGSITIYDSKRARALATVSLLDYEHFRVIRDAIDSQAVSVDAERLRRKARP